MRNRRHWIAAATAVLLSPHLSQASEGSTVQTRRRGAALPPPPPEPALLTISGTIAASNRGPLDPALDQLMVRHKLRFDRALSLSWLDLLQMPAFDIRTTLEYDRRVHALRGPLLADLVKAMQPTVADPLLVLRAVDGYAVSVRTSEAAEKGFIIATHLDGRPMALGGLGPLWAIHDTDRDPRLQNKPLNQRFVQCPWALYHIEARA